MTKGVRIRKGSLKGSVRICEGSIMGLIGLGVRIKETFGDIEPRSKVPFKRARSRVRKGPL